MNFILIGFSGAGKTYWGQRLAERLNYSFLDTDSEIERIENKSVLDIFQHHTETYFRQKERELITQLPLQKTVIATGGGMPCYAENISLLKQKGRLIYLKANAEYLHQRIKQDLKQRPLLSGIPNLLLHIREQLAIREFFYEQADLVLDVSNISIAEDFNLGVPL